MYIVFGYLIVNVVLILFLKVNNDSNGIETKLTSLEAILYPLVIIGKGVKHLFGC